MENNKPAPEPIKLPDDRVKNEFALFISGIYKDKRPEPKVLEQLENAWYAAFAVCYTIIVIKGASLTDEEASLILSGMHQELRDKAHTRRNEIMVDKAIRDAQSNN